MPHQQFFSALVPSFRAKTIASSPYATLIHRCFLVEATDPTSIRVCAVQMLGYLFDKTLLLTRQTNHVDMKWLTYHLKVFPIGNAYLPVF